jgi:hypothetical protein
LAGIAEQKAFKLPANIGSAILVFNLKQFQQASRS